MLDYPETFCQLSELGEKLPPLPPPATFLRVDQLHVGTTMFREAQS